MLITFSPNRYEPNKFAKLKSANYASSPQKPKLERQPICDQIKFGAGGYKFDLKSVRGLPCPYCGKTMITTDEQVEFGKKMAELTGKKLRKALKHIAEEKQFPIEQKIAQLLIKQSQQRPEKNAQELLIMMFPKAEEKLIAQQKEILKPLPDIMNKLQGETKQHSMHKLGTINEIIDHCAPDYIFKKKQAIGGFYRMFEQETNPANKQILDRSLQILSTLPTSANNINAFIVKYSRRSSREIGERLLDPLLTSTEHLKPSSKNGESKAYNYLVAHKDCNTKRSSEDLNVFIDKNPHIVPLIENHVKIVTQKILNYEVFGLSHYPIQIARTLNEESKGKINIDTNEYVPPKKTLAKLQEKLTNKKPSKKATSAKTWVHPNANSGGSGSKTQPPKVASKKNKTLQGRIAETIAILRKTGQETPANPTSKAKIKEAKAETKIEVLKKELINMFESYPLKDLKTKIKEEIVSRESERTKNILKLNPAILDQRIKVEERISSLTREIHSSIKRGQKAKEESKKQEFINSFIFSRSENLKGEIREALIVKENDKVKKILKIDPAIIDERIKIEKKLTSWVQEIYSSIKKGQKTNSPLQAPTNTSSGTNKHGKRDIKAMKKDIINLFASSKSQDLREQIRQELISRESRRVRKILNINPALLEERIKIEKRLSNKTNEVYASVQAKRKLTPDLQILMSNNAEKPKNDVNSGNTSKNEAKKRAIINLFASSTSKNLEEQIRKEVISRESDNTKEILKIDLSIIEEKNRIEKRISDWTRDVYDSIEKNHKLNPIQQAQPSQNIQNGQPLNPIKVKSQPVEKNKISSEALNEASTKMGTGNLRQLKKRLKNVSVKKEKAPKIQGKVTTKPASSNKNSRKNRLAQKQQNKKH